MSEEYFVYHGLSQHVLVSKENSEVYVKLADPSKEEYVWDHEFGGQHLVYHGFQFKNGKVVNITLAALRNINPNDMKELANV